jgi:RNA polymerase-binding transcription factor DksA
VASGRFAARALYAEKEPLMAKKPSKINAAVAQSAAGKKAADGSAGGNGAAKLGKNELAKFRELLLKIRAELLGDYTSLSNGTLNHNSQEASGNLSKMPIHMADVGTDTFNQDMDIQLLEGEHRRLKLIDEALRRIDEGTYGVCLYSGKPIPKARLTAIPYARYTVEAQEELERKGELTEG